MMDEFKLELETPIYNTVKPLFVDTLKIYCKLTRYKDKLTEPVHNLMAGDFYTLFKMEYEKQTACYFIECEQEKYKAKKRRGKFTPRESWLFRRKNKAAKHFFAEIAEEARKFFEERPADGGAPAAAVEERGEQDAAQPPQEPPKQGALAGDPKPDEQANTPKKGKKSTEETKCKK